GRYRLPTPRLGLPLADFAAAAMDISDGLIQDLGHLCRLGEVAAEIDATGVPLSDAARAAGSASLSRRLTGGDDYELLLAVPPEREDRLAAAAARSGIHFTRVGRFVAGLPEVRVRGPDGHWMQFARAGWSHF
ncbi:MAG: thiamine-phosphate kinase, partial [Acetobacteraceae bacterium]